VILQRWKITHPLSARYDLDKWRLWPIVSSKKAFFVSGGLVMLKDKTCEVLVDQIESLGDVNSSNYEQTKTYQELEGNESAQGTFEQVINSPSYK